MGFIDFTNGEVLTADQMDLVMRQGIMRFADAAARDTALSEVLAEGMMAYLDDTDEVLKYDGTNWIDISGDITGVTAGTALTGGGTSGNVTLDVDESALTIAQSQVTDLVSDLSGLTSDIADKQDDVITTQGDLVIGDASGDPVRLPIGSADQVLTSDGTTVSFQDAGGGGNYTLITSGTLSSEALSITNIPQDYDDLVLEFTHAPSGNLKIRINDVSSSFYDWSRWRSNSSGLFDQTNETLWNFDEHNYLRLTLYNYTASSIRLAGEAISQYDANRFQKYLLGSSQIFSNITKISSTDAKSGTFALYGKKFI